MFSPVGQHVMCLLSPLDISYTHLLDTDADQGKNKQLCTTTPSGMPGPSEDRTADRTEHISSFQSRETIRTVHSQGLCPLKLLDECFSLVLITFKGAYYG